MRNKFAYYDRYGRSKVYVHFNVRRCKNFCGYNHSRKKCTEIFNRMQVCTKCAGENESTECNATAYSCVNCLNANRFLTKKRNTDHCADDFKNCETYKIKWEQYILDTNYP